MRQRDRSQWYVALECKLRTLFTVTTSLGVNLMTFFFGRATTDGLGWEASARALGAAFLLPCRVLPGLVYF